MEIRYFLFPIENLLLYGAEKLGKVIFFPWSWEEDGAMPCGDGISPEMANRIQALIARYRPRLLSCGCTPWTAFALAEAEAGLIPEDHERCLFAVKRMQEIVNRELDVFRFTYCRIDLQETLMGYPGRLRGRSLVCWADEELKCVTIVEEEPVYYNMAPGIGLEVPFEPERRLDEFARILLMEREDEVYLTYRAVLGRLGDIYHISPLNQRFELLFTALEALCGSIEEPFRVKKRYLLSMIAESQREFDLLSQQLYFFSKEIRTQVVHYGKDVLSLISREEANNMLQTFVQIIWKFCQAVIDTNLTEMAQVEARIRERGNGAFQWNRAEPQPLLVNPELTGRSLHMFIVETPGLALSRPVRQGKVLFVPKDSVLQYNMYYSTYVYLDERERSGTEEVRLPGVWMNAVSYDLAERLCAEDLDVLLFLLESGEVRALNAECPIAILLEHPWLCDDTWDVFKYANFADMLCETVAHSMDAVLLSSPEIRMGERSTLPPRVGIRNQIRGCFRLDEEEKQLRGIPGRVYEQYAAPDQPFDLEQSSEQADPVLYQCMFDGRQDEVACLLRQALRHLADCYYLQNHTLILRALFEILDMLYPFGFVQKKVKSFFAALLASTKEDYYQRCSRFKALWETYRNPLVHKGCSIYDLTSRSTEVQSLESELERMILAMCKALHLSNVTTNEQLSVLQDQAMIRLGLSRADLLSGGMEPPFSAPGSGM